MELKCFLCSKAADGFMIDAPEILTLTVTKRYVTVKIHVQQATMFVSLLANVFLYYYRILAF